MMDRIVGHKQISRGVLSREQDGVFLVYIAGETILCDLLQTSAAPVHLEQGNPVLVLLPQTEDERGVILGRIAPPTHPGVPEEIVVKARKNFTIECGEGSITLRGDGKILIKGKDLVSRAQRMNRVKGGAVAIN
jgi:hypothetical protein